jgi:serine/threonine protein kinase
MEEIKEKEPPKINSRYSWNLECLVSSCLQKNPSTRINARQLLSLPPLKNAKDCTRLIAKKIKKIQQKELNNYG